MMRRFVLYAAAPACLLLALPVASARADVAPSAVSSATALGVGSLVGVSETGATAGSDNSSAEASVVDLGGEPVLGLGGTQQSTGDSGGALLDTGNALPAQVQLAPWQSSATGSAGSGTRSSRAAAAAARAAAPGVVKAGLLQSSADASHQAGQSVGAGSSDAADVTLLDAVSLVLLHSEANSEGTGHSFLVSLNGTEIGTDDQLATTCALSVPGLLGVSCLTASGGVANGVTSGAAELLGITTPLEIIDPVAAFTATSSAGVGTPEVSPAINAPVLGDESARTLASEAPAPVGATGQLPRTGVALASLAASALGAIMAGAALRRLNRRLPVA